MNSLRKRLSRMLHRLAARINPGGGLSSLTYAQFVERWEAGQPTYSDPAMNAQWARVKYEEHK